MGHSGKLARDLRYKCISNPKDYGVGHFQVSINLSKMFCKILIFYYKKIGLL